MILQIFLAVSAAYLLYYLFSRSRSDHFDLRYGLAFDRSAHPRAFRFVQAAIIVMAAFLTAVAAGALGSLT